MSTSTDEFLEHNGVKGMKWGVHKKRSASVDIVDNVTGKRVPIKYNPKKVKVATNPATGKPAFAITSRSENKNVQKQIRKAIPGHEDAIRSRDAQAKAKALGTKSLSNKELQDLITRQNLEQQYSRLNPSTKSKGKKIAGDLLGEVGKNLAKDYVKTGIKYGIKTGINAAVK